MSCNKLKENLEIGNIDVENIKPPSIMDTLKGDWIWFKTSGGFGGNTADNRFKSVIKILGQNNDGTINYEVWVRDTLFVDPLYFLNDHHDGIFVSETLFYKGNFQLQHPQWALEKIGVSDIKLPHLNPVGDWVIDFDYLVEFINGAFRRTSPLRDTLIFSQPAADGYNYYYQKIGGNEI
jgi:hypothetical protein